ncbi:MAG: hypothetical protein KIS78_08185 [Labilithrix sp.]|nr:hypothetical protein [Labilithrix sp.]
MSGLERALRLVLGDAVVDGVLARRRVRRARRASSIDVGDVVVGRTCKVRGRIAIDGAPERAPFSLRPCAFWAVHLLTKVRTEDRHGREIVVWRTDVEASSARPFWLVDDRGDGVLVEPEGAHVSVPTARLDPDHPHLNDENPTFRAFLRSHGVLTTAFMGVAGEHQFFESALRHGELLAAYGRVDEVARPAPQGYRDGLARDRRLRSVDGEPIVLFAR